MWPRLRPSRPSALATGLCSMSNSRSRPTNPSPLNSIRITSPMRYISPSAFLPPPSPPPTPSPFRSVSNFFFSHSPSPPSTPNSPFSPTASKFIFPSPSPPSFPTISPSPSPSPPPTPANDFRTVKFRWPSRPQSINQPRTHTAIQDKIFSQFETNSLFLLCEDLSPTFSTTMELLPSG